MNCESSGTFRKNDDFQETELGVNRIKGEGHAGVGLKMWDSHTEVASDRSEPGCRSEHQGFVMFCFH